MQIASLETICMICQNIFSGKDKKIILEYRLLIFFIFIFLPNMLSVW